MDFFFLIFAMHFWEKKIATIYLYLHNQYIDCCIELLTRFDDFNIMNLIRLKFYNLMGRILFLIFYEWIKFVCLVHEWESLGEAQNGSSGCSAHEVWLRVRYASE